MRSGVYERYARMPAPERSAFLNRLAGDASARRHASVSPNQRWLWLAERLGIGGTAYNTPLAYRFDTPVDAGTLRAAVAAMCRRHEVLRSRFVDHGGEPLVLVADAEPPFRVVDLRDRPAADREAAAAEVVAAENRRPFDLKTESPIRCTLVRVAADDDIVLINTHHIVTDGWSVGILRRELTEIYRAILAGEPADLPRLPLQYIDFAAWQLREHADNGWRRESEHWSRALRGADTRLWLPYDRPRPRRQSFAGDVVTAELPSPTVARLDEWGRSNGATPSMVFFTLYAALLSRYSGQPDFLVGVPTSGRNRSEVHDLQGMFINQLAVRADVTGDPSLSDLLGRVRGTSLAAYANDAMPFDKVAELVGARRGPDHSPLFQVLFAYDTFAAEHLELGGAHGRGFDDEGGTAKFDLTLTVTRRADDRCDLVLEYACDLFDRSTMAAFVANLVTTAEHAAATPETTVGALPLRLPETAPRTDPPQETNRSGPIRDVSPAQRRLWLLEQNEPGGGVYSVPTLLRLRGDLDTDALRLAVTDLCDRHEVLRSRFTADGGRPRATVSDEPPPFRVRTVAPVGSRRTAETMIEHEIATPFDLTRDSPIRCLVLRLDHDDHIVVLNAHHIVTDGWSEAIIRRDLSACYRARIAGTVAPAPTRRVEYRDFVDRQRDAATPADLEFWRRSLAGAPQSLSLPLDRPRPPRQDFTGATVDVTVSAPVARALTRLGRDQGASDFMVLHALWQVLLSRYSGQTDFLVGIPESGRGGGEFAEVVGLFVNTLVLRADTSGSPSFTDLLRRVRDNALDAYTHAATPLEQIVDAVGAARGPDRNPLFQVFFSHDSHHPAAGEDWAGLRAEAVDAGDTTVKFDLDLSMSTDPDGTVHASLSYATALFQPETVQRMMRHFVRIAAAVAAEPDTAIDDIDLLDAGDLARLTTAERPELPATAQLGHAFLERRTDTDPEAVAVRDRHRVLTYRDLDTQANRLAWHLRARGVGPGTLVGLCVSRDARMLVGLFGILKAGGAYLPLDPGLPAERLKTMWSDSGVELVIAESRTRPALAGFDRTVVDLDTDAAELAERPDRRPEHTATATDLAYVLYTSGSTGTPKGVMVEHRSLVSLVEYYREAFTPQRVATVLAASPLGFDASILEIFGTLPLGGTLLMADTVFDLLTLPGAEDVTMVQAVPSQMRELLRHGTLPPSVTTVCLGGEPLPGDLVARVYEIDSVERVHNIYGPTEDTVDTMWSLVPPDSTNPTIGRPLPGTRCYVLDDRLRPLPAGVPGELYLAGPGLARGYLGREDLTRDRFPADPFHPGDRMYRTGDLVRQRADGEWEYLGRVDRQVKLRGVRVELGEIERNLESLPGVDAAAVSTHTDPAGRTELVAYLVPTADWDEAAARASMRSRLPEYMVPRAFVTLTELPLTRNGKLDTRALPPPDFTTTATTTARAATTTQRQLADIWSQVLDLDTVGVHDNFFDVGGTSFGLVAVRARLDADLDRHLSMVEMHEHPTIAGLAAYLDAATRVETAAPTAQDSVADSLLRGRARLRRRRLTGPANPGAVT